MVDQTEAVVDAAKYFGISHIVKISMVGCHLTPGIQLGQWHRKSEQIIEESGISYTFLRCNWLFQTIERVNPDMYDSKKIILPIHNGKVSWIDIGDVAEVAALALTSNSHKDVIYTLTGAQSLSGQELVKTLSSVTGKEFTFESPDTELLQDEYAAFSWLEKEWLEPFMKWFDIVSIGFCGDISKDFEKITGRKPKTFKDYVLDRYQCENK
eukprot:TRINITY_DN8211_c0_g1_i2.p1 TRINITY_DN8211_c0_g1~~TRINITY_DN8211_c0_g1_i2.p1  ORF type:complete len:211 (-),score=22.46 TRINITY_DN8211_c0_g1_i2:3-635(-)